MGIIDISGGITAPRGFQAAGVHCGIKKAKKDFALVTTDAPAVAAGVFTTNVVQAAPVVLDKELCARGGLFRALAVNSGNANACTGTVGMRDAVEMAGVSADGLKIKPSLVYVGSTGVIGTPMPMDRIRSKIPELIKNIGKSSLEDVAAAIMTTDTFPKIIRKRVRIGDKTGNIAGICKGAGMICPNMATMLCFIMTDIAVSQRTLDKTLHNAVKKTFNRLTIDGDMSTNDTVLIIANGVLRNPPLTEKSASYGAFKNSIDDVAYGLSKLVAQDGEGATKFIEIEVSGARSEADAELAAFAVANSNLVKTAIYGNDANWGRIMAALGYSGAAVREEKVDIYFGKVKVASQGLSSGRDAEASEVLKKKQIKVAIDLNLGRISAKVLTCDMTEDYIRVNADYRT